MNELNPEATGNFDDHEYRAKVAETMLVEIDEFCDFYFDGGWRNHLGGSVIGERCSRKIWYAFRWAKKENPGEGCSHTRGQMRRLHQRGHREEPWFWFYLRGIGCEIYDVDPATGQQWKSSDFDDHFGLSLDSIGRLPSKFGLDEMVLFEAKTANDASYRKLAKEGLRLNKPQHWAQMCVGGVKRGINYGAYIVVNKNNDQIHLEIVKLDFAYGQELLRKANDIIYNPTDLPPVRISMNPADFQCKFCSFKDICHYSDPVDINCRSCVHAAPIADAKWVCKHHQKIIGDNLIQIGCSDHKGI